MINESEDMVRDIGIIYYTEWAIYEDMVSTWVHIGSKGRWMPSRDSAKCMCSWMGMIKINPEMLQLNNTLHFYSKYVWTFILISMIFWYLYFYFDDRPMRSSVGPWTVTRWGTAPAADLFTSLRQTSGIFPTRLTGDPRDTSHPLKTRYRLWSMFKQVFLLKERVCYSIKRITGFQTIFFFLL